MTTDILPPAGTELATERRQIHRVHWTEARDRWLETLNNRHTQRAYARAVTNLCEALDVEHVADIAPGDLTAYRNRLVQRTEAGAKNPLAPASVDQQITALRRFLLFCWVNRATTLGSERIRFCLSGLTSQVRRPYEVPSEAERTAIMQAARSRGPRAHASLGNVNDRSSYLFPSRQRRRMSPRRVRQIFSECVEAAGITDKALSPHSARHDFAIRQLRRGADLITVQKLLGHSSVETTQRYLDHIRDEELKEWALAA